MEKAAIDVTKNSHRLLNPGSVALVSVGDGNRDNLFAVTWNMPVRQNPPMVAIVCGKRHYSYPFIAETGEFAINIPSIEIVDAVMGCGSISGYKEPDKFARFGLTRGKARGIKAPLVQEAIASLECRVCQVVDLGASSLLIAQIQAAVVDPNHFSNGNWNFENGLQLIHHLGGGRFSISQQVVTATKD
ncbi:MAG: flavin reductase family protein [bacterium]|nr:flavin reductase family protein [bacterium]